ncbi:MAG: hypothetical protein AAGI06_04555, partial [Pseudomonadota bacterium]
FKGVTVQFFIKPSGTTGGVKIVEGRYNSTPVGNCLKGKFRAMRFPKHGGLNKGVQYSDSLPVNWAWSQVAS